MTGLMRIVACLIGVLCLTSFSEGAAQGSTRRITPRDLATLTDIEGLSVSPDGRWAAFQTRRADPETNSYSQAWHVIPTRGGVARRIAEGADAMPAVMASTWLYAHGYLNTPAATWSPDSQWIIYRRQDGDRIQLWRSHVDGRQSEQLTRNEGDIHTSGSGTESESSVTFSKDGLRLFFTIRLSRAQLEAALATEGRTGFRFDDRFMPRKSSLPLALPGGGSLRKLWVYDFAQPRERLANEAEIAEYTQLFSNPSIPGRGAARDPVVLSKGGSRAWTAARDPELQGVAPPKTVVAQPSGMSEPVICESEFCTEQGITLEQWRNDKEILFTRVTRERRYERTLYAWRPGDRHPPREILRTRARYTDCAVAQDRWVCFYEQMNHPKRLVAIDLDSSAIDTLYDPNPQWSHFDLGAEPQIIPFRLPTGPEGFSYLVLPPDYRPGERLPLIINAYNCYRFYDMRGAVGDEYPVFAFATQGFAVLCHAIFARDWKLASRDPTGGEPPQLAANDGDAFPKRIQAGLDAVVAELDHRGLIDPERVGITGLSLGGQTVEYALIHMRRLTAAIDSGSHFLTSAPYEAYSEGREWVRKAGFDSPCSPRFETRAISRNAQKIRAPLLMNVSDSESETESIVALQNAGRAAEMYVYPGEYHIKTQPAHRLAIYHRNMDWMNFWLRGVESRFTGESGQYERWRAMRDKHCRAVGEADPPWFCRPS